MNAATPPRSSLGNHLLDALPADARSRLLPNLELVYLPRGKIVHEKGEKLRYVYFPVNANVANLAFSESEDCTEVSMVGNEGVVGIGLFMGNEVSTRQAIVQSAGHAYQLEGTPIMKEFDLHGEMLVLLLRYAQAVITQMAQIAMCNRHHSIEQQLCRLLLQSLDRLSGNELIVTQEVIANLLGVRRESITEAVGSMRDLGLIECRRGRVKVLDRVGIEQQSCECYAVVRHEMDRLLPYTADKWRHKSKAYVRRRTVKKMEMDFRYPPASD